MEKEVARSNKQRIKTMKKSKALLESSEVEVDEVRGSNHFEEGDHPPTDMNGGSRKKKRKMKIKQDGASEEGFVVKKDGKKKNKSKIQLAEETIVGEKEVSPQEFTTMAEQEDREEEKQSSKDEEELEDDGTLEVANHADLERANGLHKLKKKKKHKLFKEVAKAEKPGVCYLSRIPPNMDHVKLRQMLSQYGEIKRIYLAPEDPTFQVQQKKPGKFKKQDFSEGWVEFSNKFIAKRVANLLNGEQIGGRKRSQFYFDLWNIKYLSKFKWDDLTEEIAYKHATRKQKLALEFSAAKRERDFYLAKVDQSRALSSIEERLKKKQKLQPEPGAQVSGNQSMKVIRQFRQTKPVADEAGKGKPKQLSKDILAGVFGSS